MFKPTPMNKVNIFAHENDILELTHALGHLGTVDLTGVDESGEWHEIDGGRWEEQREGDEKLKQDLSDIMDELGIDPSDAPSIEEAGTEDKLSAYRFEIEKIQQKIADFEEKRLSIKEKIDQLNLVKQEAFAVSKLDVPIEKLRDLEHLDTIVGSLPRENLDRLRMVLFRIPFVIVPIYEDEDWVLIIAASAQQDHAILEQALESALINRLELPEGVRGHPQEVLDSIDQDLQEANQKLEELKDKRDQIANKNQDKLLTIWTRAVYFDAVMETITGFAVHEETYLISGWVPEKDMDAVVKTVDEVTNGDADLEVLEADHTRKDTPTLLKNPKILRPFQSLVAIFGLPQYSQIDPTLFVAIIYILMFGLMFGDVGHGFILAAAGIYMLIRAKNGSTSFAPILIAAGTSGMLFGTLFGSLFGNENILPHLWLSPIDNVTTILLVSIIGGAVVLNIGFLLHLASAWRSRDWGGLLFSENGLAGIALYWVLLIGGVSIVRGASLPIYGWIFGMAIPILLIVLKEPLGQLISGSNLKPEDGWTNYLISSFFKFFESLLGYFTNTISFVRLGAFAVAHAALGQVIFRMGDLTSGVGRWLIILIGTAIIIGFEGMVVAIQALRLEYYEFFDKFFEGTGHAYQPFKLPGIEQGGTANES